MRATLVVGLLVFLFYIASAQNSFISNALGSHMVLQRSPLRANIWGWTTPGATVTVVFKAKQYQATAAASGLWSVLLEPTIAGGPYTITATSTSGASASLTDVLFGDVYVCSGQSNMQFTVHSVFNATEEIAKADGYPQIRLFTVGTGTFSVTPLDEFKTIAQPWSVASAKTVGVGDWSEFSAACWFFGKDLYDVIKVPIGLISDNWGGTPVQAWSSPDALTKCTQSAVKRSAESTGPDSPSQLWNAMIVPVLPMTILGATWYQGEANTGQQDYYACQFPAMIADWRLKWGGDTRKTFGFFYVQLAPWLQGDNTGEGLIRLGQVYANALPDVGVATAMDWGDPTSPYGSVHPRYKQIVGYRLSLLARGIIYLEKIQYTGPEAESYSVISGAPNAEVNVVFKEGTVGSGLVLRDKQCDEGVPITQCAWTEIGTDKGWVNATSIAIVDRSLSVKALIPAGSTIVGVRYAFGNYPVAPLYNVEGLPALPFYFPNPIKPVGP